MVGSSRFMSKVDLENLPTILFNDCPIPFSQNVKYLNFHIDMTSRKSQKPDLKSQVPYGAFSGWNILNICIRFVFNPRKYDHVSLYHFQIHWSPIRECRSLSFNRFFFLFYILLLLLFTHLLVFNISVLPSSFQFYSLFKSFLSGVRYLSK